MSKIFLLLLILSLIILLNTQSNDKVFKPVIGIYGNSEPENGDTYINGTYYPLSYIYWLESAGAEVMAIHYWYPLDVIDEILNKVNGVLFLGGSRSIHKDGVWEIKAKYIMDQALEIYLPVWGTCQGFQLMGIIMSGNYSGLLKNGFTDSDVLHGSEITENAYSSKMFKYFSEKDFNILQYGNSTIYNHRYGFYPEDFYKEERLNELFKVTSISEDTKGLKFIDSFEGKENYIKFFAVQYHPEKNPFKRYGYSVEQNIDSLLVSQKLAMSFIDEARKNNNRFDSSDNNEGDRAQFDFFNTYQGTPNAILKNDIYYFSKKEE